MDNTIPRERLLELMEQLGPHGTREFVAEVMDQLGMASQETFTKDDFVKVMGRITDFGKDMIQNAPLLESDDAEARTHMAAMLDALKAHALPLLQRSSADVS